MTNLTIKQDWGTQGMGISAYSDNGAIIKEAFIKDSRKYLNAVAKILKAAGIKDTKVRVNKGGIAVSGDISLEASTQNGTSVYINIGGGVHGLSTADHIGIYWRVCEKGSSTAHKGNNNWPNSNTTTSDLAQMILEVI